MKQKCINIAKNVLLVVLTLLMALLTVSIWVRSLSWEDIPVESSIGQLYIRMVYGSASVFGLRTESLPAAYPIEMAVCVDGRMVGVQYDTSGVDALHEKMQESITASLNHKDLEPSIGTDTAFLEALEQDCIYLKYANALPIDLVFLWLGGASTDLGEIQVRSILISANDEIWIRDQEDLLYCSNTDVDPKNWSEILADSIFEPCHFSTQDGLKNDLLPETLIFENRAQGYPVVETAVPNFLDSCGEDNLQIVLEAFGYNTSVGNYMDDTTRVFVNNNSTLRISDSGNILFHASSIEGGMEAYQENEITEEGKMSLRVSTAQAVLEQIQKSYTTEGGFFLQSVQEDLANDRVRLQFRYMCNSMPVMGEDGIYATVEFMKNAMVSADISARIFTNTEQMQYLIPSKQFAAMAADENTDSLIGYFAEEHGLVPYRYFERTV